MANSAYYDNFRNLLWGGATAVHTMPDMDTDTLAAHLVDVPTYTLDTANDQDEADLAGVISETALTTVTVGSVGVGVVHCDPIVFSSVSGAVSELIVISHNNGGTASTSPLICVFGDSDNTGLPVTPTGGDITAVVNAAGLLTA